MCAQSVCDFDQQAITRVVSVDVVDRLEAIQIQDTGAAGRRYCAQC